MMVHVDINLRSKNDSNMPTTTKVSHVSEQRDDINISANFKLHRPRLNSEENVERTKDHRDLDEKNLDAKKQRYANQTQPPKDSNWQPITPTEIKEGPKVLIS